MFAKFVIGLIGLVALVEAAPATELTFEQRAQEYFRTVGRLTPEYTANLACAEERLGIRPFQELKDNVQRWFGDEAVARVQADYDRIRGLIDNTPPSERAEMVERMNCVAEAQRLAEQIGAAWRDGAWAMERAQQGSGDPTGQPQTSQTPTPRPNVEQR